MRASREHCSNCQVGVGQPHLEDCDRAVCLATGRQRLYCGFNDPDHDGDCGADVWSGWPSGEAECAEFGWYVQDRGSEGLGFVPCPPDAPGAVPDFQRLERDAVWDRPTGRWRRRRAPGVPWLPTTETSAGTETPDGIETSDDPALGGLEKESTVAGTTAPRTSTTETTSSETTVPETTGGELREAPRITPTAPAPDTETTPETERPRGRWSRHVWDLAIGELPSVWSAPPTEPAALVRYAAEGSWCSPESRVWRRAGQVYCFTVAIPLSVLCYVAAWLVQRPGRLAAAALLAVIVGIVL